MIDTISSSSKRLDAQPVESGPVLRGLPSLSQDGQKQHLASPVGLNHGTTIQLCVIRLGARRYHKMALGERKRRRARESVCSNEPG